MVGTAVARVAVLTGWGDGLGALPENAVRAAAGRPAIAIPRPDLWGDRFRRATRECLLGIAAVNALLREGGMSREAIRGTATALIYVTGGAYGASNAAFIAGASRRAAAGDSREARPASARAGALHFPYTAPSAMAGEVAIEFGLTGQYGILIGGAVAAIDALWQATRLLASGRCARALVLAVETFEECEGLYARGRWLVRRPLVEAAACTLLVPGALSARYEVPREPAALETLARVRAGETFACAPLIALALAGNGGTMGPISVTGEWRGRRAGVHWE